MSFQAKGNFTVEIKPVANFGDGISRYDVTKTFHGDLEGASAGEMLAAGDPAAGNAGYVVIERITGNINGKTGSFLMQHYGILEGVQSDQKIVIIPGSGSGELAGISGQLSIDPPANHAYVLTYRF